MPWSYVRRVRGCTGQPCALQDVWIVQPVAGVQPDKAVQRLGAKAGLWGIETMHLRTFFLW